MKISTSRIDKILAEYFEVNYSLYKEAADRLDEETRYFQLIKLYTVYELKKLLKAHDISSF